MLKFPPEEFAVLITRFILKTLPLLAEEGWAPDLGRAREILAIPDVSQEPNFSRALVQARQIYVFSRFGSLLASFKYQSLADEIFSSLSNGFYAEGRGYWCDRVIRDDSSPHPVELSLYTHAFMLFGVGTYAYIAKSKVALQQVKDAISFLDRWPTDPTERIYHRRIDSKHRSLSSDFGQNEHMHLFEAYLQLATLSGEDKYLNRAGEILRSVRAVFFDDGVIYEEAKLSLDTLVVGGVYEPGHLAEWAWLCRWYYDLTGNDEVYNFGRSLLEKSRTVGWDHEYGGVYDAIESGSIAVTSKRLWPQLEALKAALVYGDTAQPTFAEHILKIVLAHYLKPDGVWVERQTRDFSNNPGIMPVSSGYHLGCAVLECLKVVPKSFLPRMF